VVVEQPFGLRLPTKISTIYNSIRVAAKALNVFPQAIIQNINSKKQKPYKGRYVFTKL
jgi:hypothetical protein